MTHAASHPETILVLGLGNTLLRDEGLGIEALRRLSADRAWPERVLLLDGGVMGLELLPFLEEAQSVLILDAVQTGDPPGTLVRLVGDEIPAAVRLKVSVHQVGLQESLAMCRLRGTLPSRLVLLGIVPAQVALGLSLSPQVEPAIDSLVRAARQELSGWGIVPGRAAIGGPGHSTRRPGRSR